MSKTSEYEEERLNQTYLEMDEQELADLVMEELYDKEKLQEEQCHTSETK